MLPRPFADAASDEVALAGADGKELARLVRDAQAKGVSRVNEVISSAVANWNSHNAPEMFTDADFRSIGDAIASVTATAELLGRSSVREQHDDNSSTPLAKFADGDTIKVLTSIEAPQAALDYFQSLYPEIDVGERWVPEQRGRGYELARDLCQNVAASVARSASTSDGTYSVQQLLDAAGVSSSNPQYSEMVFRTNAMSAYQNGAWNEAQSPDLADDFPCYQYLGIRDGRQGKDHEPHFDKYFPRTRKFTDVRGPRVYNCRCSLRWVGKREWEQLQKEGVKVS